MIDSPLVSIVVPVYNAEKYLPECILSIQKQSYTNFECLLIDDGSTDSSGIICDETSEKDQRFHSIHKANSGVSDTRNVGITQSKGKYISFIDSDDWIEPQMLESMVGIAEKDQLDIVCCDVNLADSVSGRKVLRKELCAFSQSNVITNWYNHEIILHGLNNSSLCNKLISLDFLAKSKELFPVGVRYEDNILWSRLFFLASRMECISEPYYNYRAQSESFVHEKDFRDLPGSFLVRTEEIKKHGLLQELKDDLIEYYILRLVYCFVLSKKEFRRFFYEEMQKVISECGSYSMKTKSHLPIRIFAYTYYTASICSYCLFVVFCFPFFVLSKLHILNFIRKKFV